MIRIHTSDIDRRHCGDLAVQQLRLILHKIDPTCYLELHYSGIFGVGVTLIKGDYFEKINCCWRDTTIKNSNLATSRFITYLEKITWQENN